MAGEVGKIWMVGLFFFLVLNMLYAVWAAPQVPCYFIFGDSLVDNGNNNRMASFARANYRPYGIDFPNGPTGRFCNGRTMTDIIAQLLGFDNFIPPYSNARAQELLGGVTYASAAAGIRDETGRQLGNRITMNGQLQNFKATVQQLAEILGDEKATADHLSKCIYSVGMGSNDYLNNYFMPLFYTSSRQYTVEQFADALIKQYSQQLQSLYNYGARKVAVIGVGQVGCSPFEISRFSINGTSCVARINNAIQLFNARLVPLIDDLNNKLAGARFIYVNAYGIFDDILRRASSYGFTVTNAGCCGVGRNNALITCLPLQTPCPNREEYVFWDAFHPTEATNVIIGRRSYRALSSSDSYPMDIQTLAQL
ncbi:GDSL esterase/lipase At1g29660-like [Magnolia sinica]|uniref:GDSL esterase/lipase At1g29660-like n=1 Tax=Magnolia sinica TaxID=86752 RepID=UPI00265B1FA1|nr:GDSL esterase/lipase At1g29660-like [Magnolia sinica]